MRVSDRFWNQLVLRELLFLLGLLIFLSHWRQGTLPHSAIYPTLSNMVDMPVTEGCEPSSNTKRGSLVQAMFLCSLATDFMVWTVTFWKSGAIPCLPHDKVFHLKLEDTKIWKCISYSLCLLLSCKEKSNYKCFSNHTEDSILWMVELENKKSLSVKYPN